MSSKEKITPQEHTAAIFKEYTTQSRLLRSFTNLSNTVIQTALSGQNKFVYEILQNADDSFEDDHKAIEIQFILQDNYVIVQHNGKGFDYYDVERICDYASQIQEVKDNDLSKTGYKGLGFKSLFNLSDCIYVHSNGYSFRFDKTYWPDASTRPWQVIPIWCSSDELPLSKKFALNKPVNFILKVNDTNLILKHLEELVGKPEVLLYLNHIDKIGVTFKSTKHSLMKKVEKFGVFNKVDLYNNGKIVSTWLLRTYKRNVPKQIRDSISGASRFIYPEKIKMAEEISFTFALRSNTAVDEIIKIKGLCHSTLPTQLYLTLPYHINSFFILNLDRTQLHENEWNEFLIYEISLLQFSLLKDLAETSLKNSVILLFTRKIEHSYQMFKAAFLKGFNEAKKKIAWLPAHRGPRLLKLGEAWVDETQFFKQNFQNIRDEKIEPFLIDYDVKEQHYLSDSEAERFTYSRLFKDFPKKYYPQLTKSSYLKFISYLYESLKDNYYCPVRDVCFLRAKNQTLLSPGKALLEDGENLIPEFLMLNPVDNEYLPSSNANSIKNWLVSLGAKQLNRPIDVIRESVLKWLDSGVPALKYEKNHLEIINYLAKDFHQLTLEETEKLKNKLQILTESGKFEKATSCYFPDAVSIAELKDVISDNYKIASCYSMHSLKEFFVHIGVNRTLDPFDVLRKIIMWINNGEIRHRVTISNYYPIIEYVAQYYTSIKRKLTGNQIKEIKNMPILTLSQSFTRAQDCYFESALPNVKGLDCAISKTNVVSIENVSTDVENFLIGIGVSERIPSTLVLRNSVLKWIQEGQIQSRITLDNHHDILKYIAEEWGNLLSYDGLRPPEIEALKKIPILMKNNTFRPAYKGYLPFNSGNMFPEKIPGLDSIISSDEFISSVYKISPKIIILLEKFDARNLRFTDIYERYSDHLKEPENVKWFFSNLNTYWSEKKSRSNTDDLLKCLQEKFKSTPCLLAKNGKLYRSTEIYTPEFEFMHNLNPDLIPLLNFEGELKSDLETWLGFKNELEITCIARLLETVGGKSDLGEKQTVEFFSRLLEQLKKKKKSEIQKCSLSLFSEENKLKPAKDLYYFKEEDAVCYLDSYYLKRIHGMSHEDTLKLAELCGVNVLPFERKITFGHDEPIYDDTLKHFYLERLPFIVLQESKKLHESPSTVLERLYSKISSIELNKCRQIFVQYPFGSPRKILSHFEDLKVYISGRWNGMEKTKVCKYINAALNLKTNKTKITQIMNMDPTEDKEDWLNLNNESEEKLHSIEKELQELISQEQNALLTLSDDENLMVGSHGRKKGKRSSGGRRNRNRSNRRKSGSFQESPQSPQDDKNRPTNWLREKYVFTFLQDHYKNKYPDSQVNLSAGTFTLESPQSVKIELIWFNKDEDKEHPYDLLLKKNDEIQRLIEVESTDVEQDDSLDLRHGKFIRRINDIAKVLPQFKEKYCVYRVFNIKNPSTAVRVADANSPFALYKIVPLVHEN